MSLISNDVKLHDEKSDTLARVYATNNLYDLGQVAFLFTDNGGQKFRGVLKAATDLRERNYVIVLKEVEI